MDYRAANQEWWDERAPAHAGPNRYYEVDRFQNDPAFLSTAVRLDSPLLADPAGLTGVHLQCHIGRTRSRWPGWARG